jgi:hypothetical protein
MTSDPKECRENASRCMESAEKATDSQLKAILEGLAAKWLKRAVEAERAQGLRVERELEPK